MSNIAIIPARGGSKRLPGKNIMPFFGKPMILWTLDAAKECGLFSDIVVSTEDSQISQMVEENGYTAFKRSEEFASDTASLEDVCQEVLNFYLSAGKEYNILCCLYATAPMRDAMDIKNTMSLLENGDTDFAYAVTDYTMPPHQMMYKDELGYLNYAWPLIKSMRTQDVPRPLIDNGSTYAAKVAAFRKYHSLGGPRLRGYYMPRMRSVDIDTGDDLEMAECFFSWLEQKAQKV